MRIFFYLITVSVPLAFFVTSLDHINDPAPLHVWAMFVAWFVIVTALWIWRRGFTPENWGLA